MSQVFEKTVMAKWESKRNDAVKRGLEFNLSLVSVRNLLKAKKCFYTGVPISYEEHRPKGVDKLTFDRIDPKKGYIKGNVVACSNQANQVKQAFEHYQWMFEKIMKKMSKLVTPELKPHTFQKPITIEENNV